MRSAAGLPPPCPASGFRHQMHAADQACASPTSLAWSASRCWRTATAWGNAVADEIRWWGCSLGHGGALRSRWSTGTAIRPPPPASGVHVGHGDAELGIVETDWPSTHRPLGPSSHEGCGSRLRITASGIADVGHLVTGLRAEDGGMAWPVRTIGPPALRLHRRAGGGQARKVGRAPRTDCRHRPDLPPLAADADSVGLL
jgi:hypothetical protein